MPRYKAWAEPAHIKSRYGANGLFSIIFCLVKTGAGPGNVKSRYGANGVHEC